MLLGYLAAVGFIFLLIIGIYCFGYAARHSSLLHVLLLETLLGVVLLFPLLVLQDGGSVEHLFSRVPPANLWWLGVAALCGFAGGNYFSLLNLRTAGEKVNSLLSPAITAFAMVLGFIFLQDRLSPLQWSGALITLAVITYFLNTQRRNSASARLSRCGLWSGVATVVCISCGIISAMKGVAGHISFLQAIWLRLLFALLIIAIVFFFQKEYRFVKLQHTKYYLAITGGVAAQTILANYLWFYASLTLGFSSVQLLIATLPLWVYGAEVYLLKKSSPSPHFIFISLLASLGILLALY
jgi:drug/metabolite transporter (DMT)-like permease